MGLFDAMLSRVVGGEMATIVSELIEKYGGVQGTVAQLENRGLSGAVKSWVGTGANLPISADQVHLAFGADMICELAAKYGLRPQHLAERLAQALPQAIDEFPPTGVVQPA